MKTSYSKEKKGQKGLRVEDEKRKTTIEEKLEERKEDKWLEGRQGLKTNFGIEKNGLIGLTVEDGRRKTRDEYKLEERNELIGRIDR